MPRSRLLILKRAAGEARCEASQAHKLTMSKTRCKNVAPPASSRWGRPTIVTRCFMRIVSWSERLNLAFSTVGNPPIYDNAVFPWTCLIEKECALFALSLSGCSRGRMSCPLSMSWPQMFQRSAGTMAGRVLSWRPTAFARRTILAYARKHGESARTFRGSSA